MYATCLFCHSALGANESIEHFPVGRRLAFDATKGRLWVVCMRCERWNLSPIEERWEAIEEAELAYRSTKARVATNNIGMARMRDGTDLIRIGKPQRPEFAAWRYGNQLVNRTRSNVVRGLGLAAATGAGVASAAALAGAAAGIGVAVVAFASWLSMAESRVTVVHDGPGNIYQLSRNQIIYSTIRCGFSDDRFSLRFVADIYKPAQTFWEKLKPVRPSVFLPEASSEYATELNGEIGLRALSEMLPVLNSMNLNRHVQNAVSLVETKMTPAALMWDIRKLPKRILFDHRSADGVTMRAAFMPAAHRLALEMSLHEADERRALEGELAELEMRWKQAEEIAAIADGLFVSHKSDKSAGNRD